MDKQRIWLWIAACIAPQFPIPKTLSKSAYLIIIVIKFSDT